MQREQLVGIALALVAGSGLLSGLLGRRSSYSQGLATLVNLAGCFLLLGLAIQYWLSLVQPDSENQDPTQNRSNLGLSPPIADCRD
jgi:hypothetical protein